MRVIVRVCAAVQLAAAVAVIAPGCAMSRKDGAARTQSRSTVVVPTLVDGGRAIVLPSSENSPTTAIYSQSFPAVEILTVVADGKTVMPIRVTSDFYHIDTSKRRVDGEYVYLVKSGDDNSIRNGWCLHSSARMVQDADSCIQDYLISKKADSVDVPRLLTQNDSAPAES